jgi:hypothetical protein
MTVAVPKADLYAKLDAWLEENEPIKLHKPGGKGHNQKRHGNRARQAGIFADSTGTFSDSDRTLKTAANRISSIGAAVNKNGGYAQWYESTKNKERRVSLDGGGNSAVHITRKFGDKGGWAVSTGEFSKRRKFGEFADKKEAIDWVNKSTKATRHTVTRVKAHSPLQQLGTGRAGEYRRGDAIRTNDIQLASESPFPLWRELREEEQHVALAQIVGRLDQGTATIQRIIRRAREDWVEELEGKVRRAVAEGPIAIGEITINPASVKRLSRQLAKEMESLFQFGQDQMQNELDSMQESMAMRDDDPNVREIRELFLARARIMSVAVTQAIERTAQSYAENMWRTLGPDGITVAEIDIMTGEMLKIGDQQARRAALNNVSESYSMGRHYKAMRNIDKIGFALYSSVLDGKTCRPCANADGKRVQVGTDQYYKFLPPHRNCAGRGACRCMYIYVLKTESLLNDEEGIKLHKPGGKGHNQRRHGARSSKTDSVWFGEQPTDSFAKSLHTNQLKIESAIKDQPWMKGAKTKGGNVYGVKSKATAKNQPKPTSTSGKEWKEYQMRYTSWKAAREGQPQFINRGAQSKTADYDPNIGKANAKAYLAQRQVYGAPKTESSAKKLQSLEPNDRQRYYNTTRSYEKTVDNASKVKYTPNERRALTKWIGTADNPTGQNHRRVRKAVAEGRRTNESENFMSAVRKSPTYSGDIHRGIAFENPQQAKTFVDSVRGGKSFSEKSPSSYTPNFDVAASFSSSSQGSGAMITIRNSRRSRYIGGAGGEDEVISMPKTRYRITSVREKDYAGESIMHITMVEN